MEEVFEDKVELDEEDVLVKKMERIHSGFGLCFHLAWARV